VATFHIFGVPVTVDFSPSLTEKQVEQAGEQFEQAKADGDTIARLKIGTHLLEQGYVYNPTTKEWYPMPPSCGDDE
jgi:hypothetical protein